MRQDQYHSWLVECIVLESGVSCCSGMVWAWVCVFVSEGSDCGLRPPSTAFATHRDALSVMFAVAGR